MRGERVKARLARGETVTGAWIDFGSAEVAEAMVHAGWDVLMVDCEHGAAGIEDAVPIARAIEAAGGEALVRVPSGEEAVLKRALDRGLRNLMVPMVNSAEQAARIAGFCRYPPRGRRGYAATVSRASGYGAQADYAARAHDDLLLMVQIEHADAVADFEAIAATPGVDMAFVGPNDLAGSIDRLEKLDHPDVVAQLREVERKAAAAGAAIGTITGPGRDWAALRDLGYRLILGPADVGLLTGAARAAAAARDAALGGAG
jgi:4-hydroxy-2-oxoheptanedioate aldolase